MTKVFISYSRKDKVFAEKLNAVLKLSNLDSWIDWDDIPPTADWWDQIQKGIETADAFLFLLSPDSVSSKVCGQEIDHAVQNGKRLIPLVVRDVNANDVHIALTKLNWIFFREQDNFAKSLRKLEAGIKTDLAWVESHRRLQVRAIEWGKQKDRSLLLRGKDLREAEEQLASAREKDPQPTDLQRQYVLESRRGESWTRNIVMVIGGIAIVALAFLSVFAFNQRDSAVKQAKIARGQVLASGSGSQLLSQRQNLDMLLAVEAYKLVADLPHSERIMPEQALRDSLSQVGGVIISGARGNVTETAISWDNRWLAVGGLDSNIRIWDLQNPSANPVVLRAHEDYLEALVFSPDGKWFVSVSADDTAKFWLMEDLSKEFFTVKNFGKSSTSRLILVFSPDGRWLAEGNRASTVVHLWDMNNLSAKPAEIPGNKDTISGIAFSPDGNWLATGSFDNTARLWDMRNLSSDPIILEGVQGERSSFPVAFSPDGNWLATGSNDKTIRFWNMNDLSAPPSVLKKTRGIVYEMVFSPDSQWLATVGDDNAALVWNLQDFSFEPVLIYQATDDSKVLKFGPNFHWLAERSSTDSANNVRLWDLENLFVEPATLFLDDYTNSIAFSMDGNWFARAGSGATVQLQNVHDLASDPLIIKDHYRFAFSPDGVWLATVGTDNSIRLWGMKNLAADPVILVGQDVAISTLVFSPNGNWLAAGGSDNTVRLLNVRSPSEKPIILDGHKNAIFDMAFSPDGNWFATSSWDNTIQLRNMTNPSTDPIIINDEQVSHLAFSPDGHWLATGGEDDAVRLWDLQNPSNEPVSYSYNGNVYTLTFSPDGRWLAAGGSDSAIYMWNTQDLSEAPLLLHGHEYYVRSLAFSPDGLWLASGSDDGTARLWDMQNLSLAPIVFHRPNGGVYYVAFSSDGDFLATGSGGIVSLWNLNTDELVQTACNVAGRNLTQAEWTNYFPNEEYRATCPQWPLEVTAQAVTNGSVPSSYRPSRLFYISVLILCFFSILIMIAANGIYYFYTKRKSRQED